MSDYKEHISHYTAADIQRYVQGKLSAREMHAMEKAALDDPFLADAIEGMQQAFTEHDENLVAGQLQQLQQQFQTRTTGAAKVVAFKPFRYWQAAAAAVAVIVTGVWIYSLVNNTAVTTHKTIARTENNKAQAQQTQEQLPKQQETASALANGKEITTDSALQENRNAVASSKPVPGKIADKDTGRGYRDAVAPQASAEPKMLSFDVAKQRTDSTRQELNNAAGAPLPNMRDVAVEKKEPAPAAAAVPESLLKARKADEANAAERERETELITIARNDSYKKQVASNNKDNKNLAGFIKGKVTDHNNNPIANAYLQIPNNRNNFYTDKTGFFKIPVNDSVVDVAVNVTGYGTQNFRLQNNAALNQLQLQPANMALKEVEVTPIKGKKLATSSNKYPNVMVHDAEPVFGWVAFDQYLEKNKKIPAGVPALTGNVLVSFQVNKKGELFDFKVDQSLSKAYDDEAIRLIMQGPSWKVLKGRKARVTVMIRF